MTITDEGIDWDLIVGSPDHLHAACCSRDEFVCGAPWHTEALAQADAEQELCPDCEHIVNEYTCPAYGPMPPHAHCPWAGTRNGICNTGFRGA